MDKKERNIQIKLVEQIVAEYKALVSGEIEERGSCSLCLRRMVFQPSGYKCNVCIYVVITGHNCFGEKTNHSSVDQIIPTYIKDGILKFEARARLAYLEEVFLPMAREWEPDETIQKGDI